MVTRERTNFLPMLKRLQTLKWRRKSDNYGIAGDDQGTSERIYLYLPLFIWEIGKRKLISSGHHEG